MSNINILITLDTDEIIHQQLVEDYGHIKEIDGKYINVVVLDNNNTMSFINGADIAKKTYLEIPKANKNDDIQWRVFSLSSKNTSVNSHDVIILSDLKVTNDTIKAIHSPIDLDISKFNSPIINDKAKTSTPPTLNYITTQENTWTSHIDVDTKQTQELVATFAVCNTKSKQIIGYFKWTHKIMIGSK
ncbi:AidA/PixA family protein [Xenorhabdus nematophila]|uniref:AidA/PixA family protein n=1 Tax=Xenorhabdus nematophila TaxID=628 RepID=UPI00032754E1|nr:AidA/PixA family protein [Xenorhabdus nematophila]CCW32920.1 hypothetical protein XNC3_910001 [Xenorhabdus nematophila F1]